MAVIAAGCVLAGTWQISRYEQTARTNRALRTNAHAATVDFASMGVPLVGDGPAPGRDAIRYRTVTVSGTYLAGSPELLRDRSVGGRPGFYVVSALRTAAGVLIVVRGFVAGDGDGTRSPAVAAPAPGVVQVVGRLQTADTGSDGAGELGGGQIDAINPREQAARLGAPVFAAYLTLSAHQPGGAGLTALPAPDLSNPAGGAVEPQHLAYIVQWYLFAVLALAAPFAVARSEVREARRTYLGIDPDGGDFGAAPAAAQPELAAAQPESAAARPAGVVAVRDQGGLLRRDANHTERWERAERLASRYGRSLGAGPRSAPEPVLRPAATVRPGGRETGYAVANSADRPHRSPDAYHGSYNDYLWQLAMADGDIPHVSGPPDPAARSTLPPPIIGADGRVVVTSIEPGGPPSTEIMPADDPVEPAPEDREGRQRR